MIFGCGSNVVDYFYKVQAFPKPGAKGFFADRFRPLANTVVGGVTLNHLAWAHALGAKSGLIALQVGSQSVRSPPCISAVQPPSFAG